MKRNLMKILIVCSIMILFGSGFAWAGGRGHHSRPPGASHYKGYQHHGGGWGYRHHGATHHHYRHGYAPRYHHYRYYGPPAYYHHYKRYGYPGGYYPGGWGGYDGGYYFSGGYSEPGFGFVFGTRGNW